MFKKYGDVTPVTYLDKDGKEVTEEELDDLVTPAEPEEDKLEEGE